jgi:Xaa-Pro aminopeptidase
VEGIALMGRPPAAGFGPGSPDSISTDDVIVVDLEWGGPSGYWLELRRCFSFGTPSDPVRRFWEARVEAFEACVDAVVVGASSSDIVSARDRVYGPYGLTAGEEVRYSAHGIGIDSLEPPWVPGKERMLREGMMLSLHPNVVLDDADAAVYGGVSVGDNVLVTAQGARRMTYDTEEWVTLDA